jgi:hypothetical protein
MSTTTNSHNMENLHTFRTHDREAQPIDLSHTRSPKKLGMLMHLHVHTLDPERKASRIPENLA